MSVEFNGFINKTDRIIGMWFCWVDRKGRWWVITTDPTLTRSAIYYDFWGIKIKNKIYIGVF